MAIKVYAEIGKLNHIGRVGENKAETLIFDVSKIIDNFGASGVFRANILLVLVEENVK